MRKPHCGRYLTGRLEDEGAVKDSGIAIICLMWYGIMFVGGSFLPTVISPTGGMRRRYSIFATLSGYKQLF